MRVWNELPDALIRLVASAAALHAFEANTACIVRVASGFANRPAWIFAAVIPPHCAAALSLAMRRALGQELRRPDKQRSHGHHAHQDDPHHISPNGRRIVPGFQSRKMDMSYPSQQCEPCNHVIINLQDFPIPHWTGFPTATILGASLKRTEYCGRGNNTVLRRQTYLSQFNEENSFDRIE